MAAMGPKHFSMLREFHLADGLTLGNAASGVAAILCSLLYMESRSPAHFFAACAFTPAALIFDWFDGRVARGRRHHSALGRELDSLADIISFGVAPAVLGFAAGLRGAWDWLALIYFVCCGVSRLARYNVTAETLSTGGDKVVYFEGTPIPTTFLLTAVLAMAAWQGPLVRRLDDRIRDPASAVAAVRPLGQPHDQQDVADSEDIRPLILLIRYASTSECRCGG
jgi:CDP-diacylglycerol---serine O-phosphatidyltransferase